SAPSAVASTAPALTRDRRPARIASGNQKEGLMSRMMADCRRWPSEADCSLVIIGEEDEVVQAAAQHAASVHGHEDTPELREQLRGFLEPAEQYQAGTREQEALPG